jgi:prepilin peptidase CpaA
VLLAQTSAVLLFLAAALLLTVVLAAVLDLRSRRIPNLVTASAFLIALVVRSLIGFDALGAGLLGALLGFAVVFPLFAMRGIGGGDAKLVIAVGAFLGPSGMVVALLATALAGGVMSLAAAARSGVVLPALYNSGGLIKWVFTLGRHGERTTLLAPGVVSVPYGVAIAAGTMVALFLRGGIS